MIQYADDYQIYKPNQQGTGGALALSFSARGIFLKIAKQLGTQRMFDWKPATILALNLTDISKVLAGLQSKKETSLFHDASVSSQATSNAQKGLKITWNEQYGNFFWELWRKEGEAKVSAGVSVSVEEAIVIETLLKWAIPQLLHWQIVDTSTAEPRAAGASQPAQGAQESYSDMPAGLDAVFPGAEVVQERTKEDKLKEIMQLAKTKLGAVSADDAKQKVMEKTNLPFIDSNLDAIIVNLNGI